MVIYGKVAKIQDKYRLFINKGANDGVQKGMKFIVYRELEDVFDPDTKEFLGKDEYIKAQLIAINVQEKMALLESDQFETVKGAMSGLTVTSIFQDYLVKTALPVDISDAGDIKNNEKIKVGDLIRSKIE